MAKHYIRKNESDIIIKAFSDAFEQSEEEDIEITENNKGNIYDDLSTGLNGRHFNPILTDENNKYKWKYVNNKITERTDDKKYLIEDLKTDKKSKISQSVFVILTNTDWKVIRHRDQIDNSETTSLSSGEYTTLLNARKSIRDQSNVLEEEIDALNTRKEVLDHTYSFTDLPS